MAGNLEVVLQGEIFMSCSIVTPKDSDTLSKALVSKGAQVLGAVGPVRNWKEN